MCSANGLHDLKRLCQNGRVHEALEFASHKLASGPEVSSRVFHIIAQACIHKASLEQSRFLLGLIVRHGLVLEPILGCQFIRFFTTHNCLQEANQVFNCLPNPNRFAWSAIISAHATLGQGHRAIELYHRMQYLGVDPDGPVFVAALKGCAIIKAVSEGKHIEIDVKGSSCKSNVIVANAIIDMYVKCGSLDDACKVFTEMPNRDVITWNTLILGYASQGHNDKAINLFTEMCGERMIPDSVTFVSILKACDKPIYLIDGRIVHALVAEDNVELDVRVGNTLIHMYALCGSLYDARRVFDNLPHSAVVTWNALISGYIEQKQPVEAFLVFQLMQQKGMQPNRVTFLCIIKACTEMASSDLGKGTHTLITETGVERDTTISNALINMYSKRGDVEEAHWVFTRLPEPAIITWNTLISSFVQHGEAHKAFECFNEMLQREMQPDQVTFVSILRACFPGFDTHSGFEIHAFIIFAGFNGEVIIGNSLMDMYIRYSNLKDAHRVFDQLRNRDTVSWNTMMTGYIQHLHNQEASALFHQMQLEGGEPDRATFLCVLKACSDISSVDQIDVLLYLAVESGFESDEVIQGSLFNMYIKFGNMKNATYISCLLPNMDLVTWNALIAGYAQHGDSKAAQQLFRSMQSEGLQPDDTTFLSLLSSISHVGSLADGQSLFQRMQEEYGVFPGLGHFNCLVDLLGRAGHIKEAEDLLQSMPPVPDIVGWTSLLEHSKTHANLEIGRRCYSQFVSLNEEDASGYVLMWKMFSQYWREDGAISMEELLQRVDSLNMSRQQKMKS